MIPYWLMFGATALGAMHFGHRQRQGSQLMLVFAAIAIALLIGLRFEVGGDWETYQTIYYTIYHLPVRDALGQTDAGYAFLNWLAAQLGAGVWFVNLACGAMVMAGVGRLCAQQPNPFLAMLVAIPYLIIVVSMGYTRQAASIGLVCMAITAGNPNRMLKMMVWIGLATLMHKTALLALPIMLVPVLRRNVVAAAGGAVFFAVVFYLALRDTADVMVENYVEGSYDSDGALIRVAMNVVAGALFLAFRRRFRFEPFQANYWTISAILAVVSLFALAVAPSSSGIDRLALFLIPLQVVVLSRLPYLSADGRANRELVIAVLAYCAMVQGVWLFAASHADEWLPYQTVIGQSDNE